MATITQDINENIRWYKANDPYYYEVDNLPLIDLLSNDKILRDEINLILADETNYASESFVTDNLQAAIDPGGSTIDLTGGTTTYSDVISWIIAQGYLSTVSTKLSELEDVDTPLTDRHAILEQRFVGGQASYKHLGTGQIYASRTILFSEYDKAPKEINFGANFNANTVAQHVGLSNGSLPNLSHFIIITGSNKGGTFNTAMSIKVIDGIRTSTRTLLSTGGAINESETNIFGEFHIAAKSTNTSNIQVTLTNGGATKRLEIVGWVETQRFRAILD